MADMANGYLAVDLGAESGRVIVGVMEGERLRLHEAHRFGHEPIWLPTGLHWNTTNIWSEIVRGLRRAAEWAKSNRIELLSVGADTWGVDWALVDSSGELAGLPHAYRDPRNDRAYEKVLAKVGADRIYRTTGIQFMPLNSLYSLYAHLDGRLGDKCLLDNARRLFFMPDLIHFWLSGQRTIEATIASTSQMVDCHTGQWADGLLHELGLPVPELAPTTEPGNVIGGLLRKVGDETGLGPQLKIVAPAAHDTASAVAAVPASGHESWCFLSSGTWSLLGVETGQPCVNTQAQAASFTNERGVNGTFRFLTNIAGLWLVQECRRDLARQGTDLDYSALTKLAREAAPLRTIVDPGHGPFQSPGGMLEKMREYARTTDQPLPDSPGEFVRGALESLALAYREKLLAMEAILGRRFDVIHVVGGGGKNELLSQMTADATGRRVVVGPNEATAMGNLLLQATASGEVRDLTHLRKIVAASTELAVYEPASSADWDDAYDRYCRLVSG